jgi:hypothetical protein
MMTRFIMNLKQQTAKLAITLPASAVILYDLSQEDNIYRHNGRDCDFDGQHLGHQYD